MHAGTIFMSTETILILASSAVILSLAATLAIKISRIRLLQNDVDRLRQSLDEMDEQAKLIIRTDMELNKTQEELDKKVNGLYALQKLSRAISTTLEETQIFKRIHPSYLEDLGFEKACCFLWEDQQKPLCQSLRWATPKRRSTPSGICSLRIKIFS